MSPETIQSVQDSFKKVVPIAGTAADIFYTRLFEIAPEVRPMFPENMIKQKGKLMQMLGTAVQNLHRLQDVLPAIQELGVKHISYGVKDAHYDIVGSALLYTLEKGLGDSWTSGLKADWTEVYTALATIMKEAAATQQAAE